MATANKKISELFSGAAVSARPTITPRVFDLASASMKSPEKFIADGGVCRGAADATANIVTNYHFPARVAFTKRADGPLHAFMEKKCTPQKDKYTQGFPQYVPPPEGTVKIYSFVTALATLFREITSTDFIPKLKHTPNMTAKVQGLLQLNRCRGLIVSAPT